MGGLLGERFVKGLGAVSPPKWSGLKTVVEDCDATTGEVLGNVLDIAALLPSKGQSDLILHGTHHLLLNHPGVVRSLVT